MCFPRFLGPQKKRKENKRKGASLYTEHKKRERIDTELKCPSLYIHQLLDDELLQNPVTETTTIYYFSCSWGLAELFLCRFCLGSLGRLSLAGWAKIAPLTCLGVGAGYWQKLLLSPRTLIRQQAGLSSFAAWASQGSKRARGEAAKPLSA